MDAFLGHRAGMASGQYGASGGAAPTMSVVERTRVAPSTGRRRHFGGLARRAAASAPPESFFVGSAVYHYLGPAFAVLLFALVEPVGVAWLRIAIAAAVFAA